VAATTADKPTTDPDERSIPALTIHPVTPSAIRPTTDICRTILIRLVLLRNAGDSIEAVTTMRAKIRKIPYLLKMLAST
jgi:hypothetical protein